MLLHSFNRHNGVKLIEPADDLLRPVPLGNVVAHNLVRNDRRRKALDVHVSDYFWHRRMMSGFSMKTVMAEVHRPGFKRAFMSSGGKVLLNGSAGDRARNFVRKNMEYSEESLEYFRRSYGELSKPENIYSNAFHAEDCWIEVKNFYNFFHFLTESFHKVFVDREEMRSVRKIVLKSKSTRIEEFANLWIKDCEELIGGKVSIEVEQSVSDEMPSAVLTPMSSKHLLYQISGTHHGMIEGARPPGHSWLGYDSTPHPVKVFGLNSFDDSLLDFRKAVIDLAKKKIPARWGRKIYAARSKGLLRNRVMKGEEGLIAALERRGFEVVYFEEMSPLEQIRCVSGARCVVMQHGAGMTNMLFANSNAHIFELGTYQTAMARWADFMPLCHAAQCHYHHIFLDMDFDNEDSDPVFANDGLVAPVLSGEDVERVTSIILGGIKDKIDGAIGGMATHSAYLIDRGAYRQAYRLYDSCESFMGGYREYWEGRAGLNELCGHRKAACDSYAKAWRISKSAETLAAFLRIAEPDDLERHADLR